MSAHARAFTLVELLVVVAIITVLMALLAPALDQAMQQAMLAQCSGNVKALATGGLLYAQANKRYYMAAEAPRVRGGDQPNLMGLKNQPAKDLRPLFQADSQPWEKLLVCPLGGKIDLSYEANDADTEVYSNYYIYFGWQYAIDQNNTLGGRKMSKLGDRFSSTDNTGSDQTREFRVLIADQFLERNPTAHTQSSHQDRGGRQFLVLMQNAVEKPSLEFSGVGVGGQAATFSEWRGIRRALLDVNYGMDDGAVLRIDAEPLDERLQSAQPRRNRTNNGYGQRLPQ